MPDANPNRSDVALQRNAEAPQLSRGNCYQHARSWLSRTCAKSALRQTDPSYAACSFAQMHLGSHRS